MKEIPLPQTQSDRARKRASLRRVCTLLGVLTVVCAVAAVLLLLGVIAAVIVAEFHPAVSLLCYILSGAFAGGAIVFAMLAILFGKASSRMNRRTSDFCERCDDENSFYIGEGTLATFGAAQMRIHGETGGKEIFVPYSEIRAFSVCMRKAPRERGEWSVVFEIPAHYLLKDGASGDAEPALVQTDAKDRLYRVLSQCGIPLLGETPAPDAKNLKFKPDRKFYLPNRKKRKRALILLAAGVVLIAAAVPVAVLLDSAVGAVIGVFGLFFGGRALIAFLGARAMLAFYPEGLFWRESERNESMFLKWSEIESIRAEEQKGFPVLTLECMYGAYRVPRVAGSLEYLQNYRPEKIGKEA